MDGKICVVTGATQGLGGSDCPQACRRRGRRRSHHRAQLTRGQAVACSLSEAHNLPVHVTRADFASVADCRHVIAETDRLFGRSGVLVNAGASTARGTIIDTSPETFDARFSTNVRDPCFLMQEAIKLMIRDGIEGAICNIGSISALAAQPFINACCASKVP